MYFINERHQLVSYLIQEIDFFFLLQSVLSIYSLSDCHRFLTALNTPLVFELIHSLIFLINFICFFLSHSFLYICLNLFLHKYLFLETPHSGDLFLEFFLL